MGYTLSNDVEWLPNQGWDARIHVAANANLVNVFMVVTARYVVLVDTLLNATTATALLEHARPYLTGRQLLVVNTHADWDHAWGNQVFAGPTAAYPAPILANVTCAARLRARASQETLGHMRQERADLFDEVILTPPTITFDNTLVIDGGDLTLELLATPGHTPDHLAIYLPEIRTLLPGDAAELPFPMPDTPHDLPQLRASLHRLAAYNAPTVFYCHAPTATGPRLIHHNIAYYDALERACRAARTRGFEPAQVEDADLPAALRCPLDAVAPANGAWDDLDQDDLLERHGEQLRYMWEWLTATPTQGK